MIEKLERFDENSAKKNPIQKSGGDKSIPPCQIGDVGVVLPVACHAHFSKKSRVLLVKETEKKETIKDLKCQKILKS